MTLKTAVLMASMSGLVLLASGCQSKKDSAKIDTLTVPVKNNAGELIGEAIISDAGPKGVRLVVSAKDIAEGEHGMHFHVKADCSAADFTSAGGHINPMGVKHGLKNPDGPDNADMPNAVANEMDVLTADVNNKRVTLTKRDERPALLDEDGSALIIHINPDDQMTQPIGGAGARIACAEITR